jgi:RNA polymerase sigma factor (sigma-70 family)
MSERGSREDFTRWVEPWLTVLARYAARQVGPGDRDGVVTEALVRAWQRLPSYDESRTTALAWLLGIVSERCRHHHPRDLPTTMVELVDSPVGLAPARDADLERALDGLASDQREALDLHYFVGLDAATIAELQGGTPETVTTTLQHARARLGGLVGADEDDLVERRLTAEARHWQEEQAPAPEVPLERLEPKPRLPLPWRRTVLAAAAAVALVGGGAVAVARALGGDDSTPTAAAASPTPQVEPTPGQIVPWHDLAPGHPAFDTDQAGATVTPYDHVTATGTIAGTFHPGDTVDFIVALSSPGLVSFDPCPDYTIAFGEQSVTHRLNCQQVPFFASIVRPNGKITAFRPVIPAGNVVFFRMQATVPDELGRQAVQWSLEGPTQRPAFGGVVDVTDNGTD